MYDEKVFQKQKFDFFGNIEVKSNGIKKPMRQTNIEMHSPSKRAS